MSTPALVRVVWWVIAIVGSLFAVVLLITLGHKLYTQIRWGYERRQRAAFLPRIQAYLTAEHGHFGTYVAGPLGAWDRRVILWTLLEQIRFVKGRTQERISAAFEELGFVSEERHKLTDRRSMKRVEGAEKLGRMMSRQPLPDLVRLMQDPVPEVRIRAAKALGNIGGLEAVASLLGALRDTNRWSALRIADILAGQAAIGFTATAGIPEMNEPLAVEGTRHILQYPDAPLAVLNQLVVGRQDARDPALYWERGDLHFK